MSQYEPSGRPVWKVSVSAEPPLLIAIQAASPREKAIRSLPSVVQLATAASSVSARLCQPTIASIVKFCSVHAQAPVPQTVSVTSPFEVSGGAWL